MHGVESDCIEMKKRKSELIVKRKVSSEEKQHYDKILDKEKTKYERDLKAGGVSEDGQYIRLHDRTP